MPRLDLQNLTEIKSPNQNYSFSAKSDLTSSKFSSIPTAHPEYEKELQKYEKDFRDFMNSENQLKLHIDSLQDKVIHEKAEAARHL